VGTAVQRVMKFASEDIPMNNLLGNYIIVVVKFTKSKMVMFVKLHTSESLLDLEQEMFSMQSRDMMVQ
jgi:hypothetical protein